MTIVYTATAIADLADIADFYRSRNAAAGERIAETLRLAIERLDLFPFSGRAQDRSRVR